MKYALPINSVTASARFDDLDPFTQAYIECAFWLYTPADDEDPSTAPAFDELDSYSLEKIKTTCRKFQEENTAFIGDQLEQAGHDFWLTRNGHGAGFWDRSDDMYGSAENRDALDAAAKQYGEVELFRGDDSKIHYSSW